VDVDVARARVGGARDRIEDRPAEYHARVREGYREAARGTGRRSALSLCYRAPIVLIDASADPVAVFRQIQSEVGRVLALDSRP
jgi:dTMP kinase